MNDPQSFQERVVNIIINGSLVNLKEIIFGQFDVNRILLPDQLIYPIPSVSKIKVRHFIHGPTMLILAVLCEKPDFVQYLLSFNPDLSIKINEYNALHYSSLTKDTGCLKIFLTCSYYQKNISEPILETISQPLLIKSTTNSLHIAVSNKNIESALLLLSDLPQTVEYFHDKNKNTKTNNNDDDDNDFDQNFDSSNENYDAKENDNNNDDEDESDDYKVEDDTDMPGIDVNLHTSNGSTPLHIAAFMRDINMCRLLLNFSADTSIRNSKGRTAAEIALNSHTKIGNEIAHILDNPPNEFEMQKFKDKYGKLKNYDQAGLSDNIDHNFRNQKPVPKIKKKYSSDSSSDYSSSDSDDNHVSLKKEKKHKHTKKLLHLLITKIDQLNTRLGILEDTVSSTIRKTPPISSQIVGSNKCFICKSLNTKKCPTCHHYFCNKCMNLSTVHHCI